MNRQTPNGNQVKRPTSRHHMLSTIRPHILFADDGAHWDTGNGPVWIRPDTGTGELHELIEKAIANRPRRAKVFDATTGSELHYESPFPPPTTFCSQA